jgi:hypothetical protein
MPEYFQSKRNNNIEKRHISSLTHFNVSKYELYCIWHGVTFDSLSQMNTKMGIDSLPYDRIGTSMQRIFMQIALKLCDQSNLIL